MLSSVVLALVLARSGAAQAATAGWSAGPEWKLTATACAADAPGDAYAWRPGWRLGHSWRFAATVRIARLKRGDTGAAGLALAGSATSPAPALLVTVTRHKMRQSLIEVEYLDGGWHKLLSSGWLPGDDERYAVTLSRALGDDFITVSVSGERGLRYSAETPPVPLRVLDALACPGLRANGAAVEFAGASLAAPYPAAATYRTIARAAVDDLLRHFWTGDAKTGHVRPTWNGYPARALPDPRGALWDRGTLVRLLENLHGSTKDAAVLERIGANWRWVKRAYSAKELETPGAMPNPASDDCGWNALALLTSYRATGDQDALRHAAALVANSFDRWQDDQMGGGLWYSDERKAKSLYQVGLVLAALEVSDLAARSPGAGRAVGSERATSLRRRAMAAYGWMEANLLRPDGLYWCDRAPAGPLGAERPDDIHEAGSVTFLGGVMGMGVLHARLYRATHDDRYLPRAIRTADAVLAKLTDGRGVLLDERDAWANGTFAGEWARDVLTLPGIRAEHRELLLGTARAIHTRDRTPDGTYGGCWNGPADGPGSRWSLVGSRPQQMMTSTNAANLVVAGAAIAGVPPRAAAVPNRAARAEH